MAKLINGSGNPAVYANEDSDLIAALAGNTTAIAAVGSEYAATQEDANTIGLADGVIITKEGRRIQLDEGKTDLFTIPTGSAGTTSYYIIGYKLTTDAESKQICETFVQKMSSSSETITEDTFKGGATDVYVSVYRVVQDGLNIDSINLLLPSLSNVGKLNSDLSAKASINNSSTTSTTATWSASKINSSLPEKTVYSTDVYVYGKVCTVFLHGDKASYSIPTPANNQYMACRTINVNNNAFGDAHLSPGGNAAFFSQTGGSVFGVITYIIA